MESNQELESVQGPSESNTNAQPIALALSGGGFRATIFHLGVARALRDCGRLKDVHLICSASGGSILAAHLALHWEKYLTEDGFEEAASEVIRCVKKDLRNSILRRWLCASSFFWIPRWLRFGRPSKILEQQYDRLLYNGATFEKLQKPGRPEIHILSTSLTTGALCRFTSSDFEIIDDPTEPAPLDSQSVAFAVAASSAFPLLFPAIPVNHETFHRNQMQFRQEHYLADGGVFDNLAIVDLTDSAHEDDLLIVSDAGANFDFKTDTYQKVVSFSRNLRANDIMMHRLGEMNLSPRRGENLLPIGIQGELPKNTANAAPDRSVQQTTRSIQTDLTAMPEVEIDALLRHGQAKMWHTLQARHMCSHAHNPWLPVGDKLSTVDVEHFDSVLKRSQWLRSVTLAFLDPVPWIALAVWVFLFWAGNYTYKEITREHGTYQRCVIHVTSANAPVDRAKVDIRLEDTAETNFGGYTNKNGDFPFFWELTKQPPWAHFLITKRGFRDFADDFILTPEPQHPISLAPTSQ